MLTTLIILNIPVYLFVGWLVFDTKDNAADTFFETIVEILKIVIGSVIVGWLIKDDEAGGWGGLIPIAIWLIACALIVYGEYRLIEKFWFADAS